MGELCPRIIAGEYCGNANCVYAHKEIEILYHPDHFKTQLCVQHTQLGGCEKKQVCCYAHGQHELRQPLQRTTQLLQQQQQQQQQHGGQGPFGGLKIGTTNVGNGMTGENNGNLFAGMTPTPIFTGGASLFSPQSKNSFTPQVMGNGGSGSGFYGGSVMSPILRNGFQESIFSPGASKIPNESLFAGTNLDALSNLTLSPRFVGDSAQIPDLMSNRSRAATQTRLQNLDFPTPVEMNSVSVRSPKQVPSVGTRPANNSNAEIFEDASAGIAFALQLANTVYARQHPNSHVQAISDLSQPEFAEVISMLKHQISICADAIGWMNFERGQQSKLTSVQRFIHTPFAEMVQDTGNETKNASVSSQKKQ